MRGRRGELHIGIQFNLSYDSSAFALILTMGAQAPADGQLFKARNYVSVL